MLSDIFKGWIFVGTKIKNVFLSWGVRYRCKKFLKVELGLILRVPYTESTYWSRHNVCGSVYQSIVVRKKLKLSSYVKAANGSVVTVLDCWAQVHQFETYYRQFDIWVGSAWKAMANYQVYNCLVTSPTSRSEPALKSRSRIPV